MLIKEQVPPVISPSPNSFAGLMEMYEMNYIQLRLLFGERCRILGDHIAHVPGHLPILLQIRDCTAHTTTLMLTYLFGHTELSYHETRPDMVIRISHDALQAEVLSHRCRLTDETISARFHGADSLLRCRWRMNRFLFKWLHHLRRKGYCFESSNFT